MSDVDKYIQILTLAAALGEDAVALWKNHAAATLTPQEYADLQSRFDEDAERAKKNAGL